MSIVSNAGTKRVVKTLTDTIWVTVHANPTNTTDLNKLEKEIIAESYEEYEKIIAYKNMNFLSKFVFRLKSLIKK